MPIQRTRTITRTRTRIRNYKHLYFKVVKTETTKIYMIDVNWSIQYFIEKLQGWIYEDLFLSNIEIVPTGQEYVAGKSAENADALKDDSEITLDAYFGKKIDTTSFYIRPKRDAPNFFQYSILNAQHLYS